LGDAGQRVILEFVGVHDRVVSKSSKPAFDTSDDVVESTEQSTVEVTTDEAAPEASEVGSVEKEEGKDD
jgi:hypothetical protein